MRKVVKITFSYLWILEHKNDKLLPVDRILNSLQLVYTDVEIVSKSFSSLTVILNADENTDIENEIKTIVQSQTDASFGNDQVSLSVFDSDDNTVQQQSDPDGNDERLCSIRKRLEGLVGCNEFSRLIEEIIGIAPQIKANKTFESFRFQNYLFAVNDGYGLSTYLNILAEVVSCLGLFEITVPKLFEEVKLVPQRNESDKELFDRYIKLLDELSGTELVCFDISHYLTKTNTPEFRDFLKSLEDMENRFIFVFRIPFVESDILENVLADINDVLFMRSITVAPFSIDELSQCLDAAVGRHGFAMDATAVEVFKKRLLQEKSDGRFYGINTVNKIVNEMIYLKQLSNVGNGSTDKLISEEDITALVSGYSEDSKTAEEMLSELTGLETVKQQLFEIVAQIEHSVKHAGVASPCIHMRFVGNPGTGKTTVARILGKMLRERGVLRNGNFFEYSGRDFCGRYIGETAPKTAGMCRDAYGSVLFIDEAYSLYTGADNMKDFGKEALVTLIAEMENHRHDLVVIMAGYKDDMDHLLECNAGLESRMPYKIEFENYSRDQLAQIFMGMIIKNFEYDTELEKAVKEYFDALPDDVIDADDFSNARYVRNLYEKTWGKAVTRCRLEKSEKIIILPMDFRNAAPHNKDVLLNAKKRARIGF